MSSPTRVKISELKAHLSAFLGKVRQGRSFTVLDRKTPIALLTPLPPEPSAALRAPPAQVRRGRGDLKRIRPLPPLALESDSLALLLADRARR
jgi:antitoxin (DNA-binding transcriptional repressor) of toxin-antitoxin stability system